MAESGVVKFYNTVKAFGFIQRQGASDVFVHRVDLLTTGIDALVEGQKVQFDVVPGREGKPKAQNVRVGIP